MSREKAELSIFLGNGCEAVVVGEAEAEDERDRNSAVAWEEQIMIG